jgi:hypothetical protein
VLPHAGFEGGGQASARRARAGDSPREPALDLGA